jgi:hypothetical protein
MKNEPKFYVGLELPSAMVARIRKDAKARGWSLTLFVRTLIEKYLKKEVHL